MKSDRGHVFFAFSHTLLAILFIYLIFSTSAYYTFVSISYGLTPNDKKNTDVFSSLSRNIEKTIGSLNEDHSKQKSVGQSNDNNNNNSTKA